MDVLRGDGTVLKLVGLTNIPRKGPFRLRRGALSLAGGYGCLRVEPANAPLTKEGCKPHQCSFSEFGLIRVTGVASKLRRSVNSHLVLDGAPSVRKRTTDESCCNRSVEPTNEATGNKVRRRRVRGRVCVLRGGGDRPTVTRSSGGLQGASACFRIPVVECTRNDLRQTSATYLHNYRQALTVTN